jgi:predicted nucleic acid-binding protein
VGKEPKGDKELSSTGTPLMGVKEARFITELKKFHKVGLDSSILIYHLEDIEPYSDLTEHIFIAVAEGSLSAAISTISVTELLVQPFIVGQEDRIEAFEQFLFSFPNAVLVPPSYFIAKEAARLRAKYMIRTPDALLVATALHGKAEAFLTNDTRLRSIKGENITIVILDDFL